MLLDSALCWIELENADISIALALMRGEFTQLQAIWGECLDPILEWRPLPVASDDHQGRPKEAECHRYSSRRFCTLLR